MPHFFGHAVDGVVELTGPDAAHLARSLRARAGETISVVDPGDGVEGRLLTVRLDSVSPAAVRGRVVDERTHRPEPARRVTLAVAMLPAPALELVLRFGTELGVAGFLLVDAERSVARGGAKAERWATICREASMLAGRLVVPPVEGPMPLVDALKLCDSPVLLDREAPTGLAEIEDSRLHLFLGPEGGFSDRECRLFERHATLGGRNLRAETAAAAAMAVALCRET